MTVTSYSTLLRWAVGRYYPDVNEINLGNIGKSYVHKNLCFVFPVNKRSYLDIYVLEDTFINADNFKEKSILVYSNKMWVAEGSWQHYIKGFFHKINKSKLEEQQEYERVRQQESEARKRLYQDRLDVVSELFEGLAKPVIELIGNNPTHIPVGFPYSERGCYAEDIYGKNITSDVQISSTVDEKVVGEYYVTYTVTDEYGAKNSTKRTVIVE